MIINDHYLHAMDPFAIQLTETFGIRWYGLAYLSGFLCGYALIAALCRRGRLMIELNQISDFVFTVALGTIVGGRLGYCLFYSPDLFMRFKWDFPFWGVLAVNEGGMASHGGIIGIVVACYIFARKHHISPVHLCDLTTLGGTVGVFFGRIANFINGELVGRPASESLLWHVKFPQDIFLWPSQDASRLESLKALTPLVGVPQDTWIKYIQSFSSDLNSWGMIEQTLTKVVDQIQAGNRSLAEAIFPLLTARHPSQLYEALLEGLLLFLLLNLIWIVPRKPGIITGAFLTFYAVVRFIGEQFRMPDPQIGFEVLGLTRGQILSIVVLLFGLVVLFLSSRFQGKPLGGWFPSKS